MAYGILMQSPKFQVVDSAGAPLSGGKLYTYGSGTTTPKATYSDRGLTTPNANPVVLDSRGEAVVWLALGAYKFVLKTSADVTVWTVDEIYGGGQLDNIITTLGDLIHGGTSGYPERLPIASEDTVLSVLSTGKWGGRNGIPAKLTNKSAVQLAANDVVIIDTSNDSAVTTTVTQGDDKAILVCSDATVAINADGLFYKDCKATVAVQGNVARGDYLRTSTTAQKAETAGVDIRTKGIFGQALTAYAGGGAGTVTALLFGLTVGVPEVPVGTISPYGGTAAPSGWLLCNGAAVSRTTYANLFAIIAELYGVGDGSTTFNLPDLRQKFPIGKAAAGTGSTLGGTGGAIDHVHTTHTHTISGFQIATVGAGSDNYLVTNLTSGASAVPADNPPFQAVNYIIRY